MSPVTTLITLDAHDHPRLSSVISTSAQMLSDLGKRVTYFIPSGFILKEPQLAAVLRESQKLGHAIGCHGLHHTREEDFRTITPKEEFAILQKATRILEDALGVRVTTFRAPVFRISKYTLPFLVELGYKADMSVTPHRLTFLSSTPWAFRGFHAPRSPYRPHRASPYRRGDLPILEIPTSCLLLPLAHGAMTVLRSNGMSLMMSALISEALRFDRVLVVSIHPESIAGDDWYCANRPVRLSDFIPRAYGGIKLRYHFGDITPERSRQLAIQMIENVSLRADIDSMSIEDYFATASFRRHYSDSSKHLPLTSEIGDNASPL